MRRRLWGISLATVLAAGLTACSGGQETADTQPATETAATVAETQETEAETQPEKEESGDGGMSWDMAEEILTHISDPVFPDLTVSVLDYGAVADDGELDMGAITLKDNVNLCLEDKETKLQFTQEISHENYPLVYSHWEGQPMYNYSAFIYAKDAVNIALTGEGTLDGQPYSDVLEQIRGM